MRIRRVPTDRFPPVKSRSTGRVPTPPKAGRAGAVRRVSRTTQGLVGGRLAAAAHPVAVRIDPERHGVGPRELQVALAAAGVAVGGGDPYIALYTALNSASGHFEKAGRGRYRWTITTER